LRSSSDFSNDNYGGWKGISGDGLQWYVYSGAGNRNYVLTDYRNKGDNHGLPESDNPTMWLFSEANVDAGEGASSQDRWGSFSHTGTAADGGSFVIDTGSGPVQFGAGVIPPRVTADPCGGAKYKRGAMFYNETSEILCICNNSGADVKVSDGSACF
jgi:hypothetical protein